MTDLYEFFSKVLEIDWRVENEEDVAESVGELMDEYIAPTFTVDDITAEGFSTEQACDIMQCIYFYTLYSSIRKIEFLCAFRTG